MEDLKCIGCGVRIQTEDKDRMGYTPQSSLAKVDDVAVSCQRCFRLKNYNEIMDTEMTSDDFLKILQGVADSDALVVNVIDVFDSTGTFVTGLSRHIGGNDVIVAANKIDLLPRSVNKGKVRHRLQKELSDAGLKPLDICVISSQTGYGIDDLMDTVERYRRGRDVYVVGCTNVGKSTFINRLIRQFSSESGNVITTSYFPGTTLDVIEIPLDEKSSIIDTPGIINSHQLVHYIKSNEFKVITPKKEIKPGVFQLNEEQTLFVGGLVRMDFVSGARTGFVTHFANDLKVHRTKMANADELWSKHAGGMLAPVIVDGDVLRGLKRNVYNVKNEKVDIVISGLGFITIPGRKQEIHVHVPDGVGVFLRKSIFD